MSIAERISQVLQARQSSADLTQKGGQRLANEVKGTVVRKVAVPAMMVLGTLIFPGCEEQPTHLAEVDNHFRASMDVYSQVMEAPFVGRDPDVAMPIALAGIADRENPKAKIEKTLVDANEAHVRFGIPKPQASALGAIANTNQHGKDINITAAYYIVAKDKTVVKQEPESAPRRAASLVSSAILNNVDVEKVAARVEDFMETNRSNVDDAISLAETSYLIGSPELTQYGYDLLRTQGVSDQNARILLQSLPLHNPDKTLQSKEAVAEAVVATMTLYNEIKDKLDPNGMPEQMPADLTVAAASDENKEDRVGRTVVIYSGGGYYNGIDYCRGVGLTRATVARNYSSSSFHSNSNLSTNYSNSITSRVIEPSSTLHTPYMPATVKTGVVVSGKYGGTGTGTAASIKSGGISGRGGVSAGGGSGGTG